MKVTPIRKRFGSQLRNLRKQRNFSQESLAAVVGVHRTYIGSIERGEQSVSVDNLKKLAKALNIKISDLVKGL